MSSMTTDEIREILNRKERWVTLSTLGPDGFPHSVPIGYFLAEDKLVMGCRDGTQKVKNIERDSRVSVLWENGRGKNTLMGILVRGHARIVRDDVERLALKAEACRQRGETPSTELSSTGVYIEVSPVKTISWNRPSAGRRPRPA